MDSRAEISSCCKSRAALSARPGATPTAAPEPVTGGRRAVMIAPDRSEYQSNEPDLLCNCLLVPTQARLALTKVVPEWTASCGNRCSSKAIAGLGRGTRIFSGVVRESAGIWCPRAAAITGTQRPATPG